MFQISDKYIDQAIADIMNSVGIKEPISYENLVGFLREGKIKECVESVARYLGLPVRIDLSYVTTNGHAPVGNTAAGVTYQAKFETQQIVRRDATGRTLESITAQVLLPVGLPMFGSSGLNGFPIDVRVSANIVSYPQTFLACIAHEMAHIVLNSLFHKEKDKEVYVDLTAMLLGFNEIMMYGRKVIEESERVTRTTTYGYLTDSQFEYAYRKVNEQMEGCKQRKQLIIEKLVIARKRLVWISKNIPVLKRRISMIDVRSRKRISEKDAKRIVLLHQRGFVEAMEKFCLEEERNLAKYCDCEQTVHYFPGQDRGLLDELEIICSNVIDMVAALKRDIKVTKRNTDLIYRIKQAFRIQRKDGTASG